ncbi:MAG: hypothetical protein JRJ12_10280 [Deltaproteobacteria bacterium]|nr:hypothetical protein [Deltaproteobacteria bacterium]MBW2070615.1 hypothetical protein [Deltaproteobacteria bacterium]
MMNRPPRKTNSILRFTHLEDENSRNIMKRMAAALNELAGLEELGLFSRRLALPLRARSLSIRILRLYDQYILHAVTGMRKKGWLLSCGRSCSSCCFEMVAGVSQWELLLIYDQMKLVGQSSRLFKRHLENCEVLSELQRELQQAVRKGVEADSDSEVELLLGAYRKQRRRCGFLTISGECIIYPVRPLACRMHFAFTPAAWCDPAHPKFGQAVRLNFHPHARVYQAVEAVDCRLGLNLDELLSPGLVAFATNVMQFSPISWAS